MVKAQRLLVLAVDVDDDLHEKARVKGPVIGRKANIEAATKLALADPQDPDANAIFEAVKQYDELGREATVEVATLTGSPRLGYHADKEIIRQLEKIVSDYKPEACVFISDGATDEQIIPLVQSRVKINSVRTVTIKQAKELEKTYVAIFEKLKEPHYARIVFGIPGLALLLFALSEFLGLKVFLALLGVYLIAKATGVEDLLLRGISGFSFSSEKLGFIFYFSAVPLAAISIWLGTARVAAMQTMGVTNLAKLAAGFMKDLLLLLPVALLLIILGKVFEALNEKKKYLLPRHVISSTAVILLWLILNNASDWVLGTLGFADFFTTIILAVAAMVLVVYLAKAFKTRIISRMQLEGKDTYTEVGGMLGKIVGINRKQEKMIIQTESGRKIDLPLDRISNVGEKIIVQY